MIASHQAQNHAAVNALIARSGIISRQILKFYRFMRETGSETDLPPHASLLERMHRKIRRILTMLKISTLADFIYTYHLGGSLTRQDQATFAQIHELGERAYLLTGVNALCFGIPTAAFYFLAGEGFQLLSRVNSFTELPALLAGNIALGLGAISLAVDLFRAFDAFTKKRCWAPFGFMPFLINFPTYLKIATTKIRVSGKATRVLE